MALGIWVKRTLTPKAVLCDTSAADMSLGAGLLTLPLQAGKFSGSAGLNLDNGCLF